MENSTQMGLNRTGTDMAPLLTKEMVSGTGMFKIGPINYDDMAAIRSSYIRLNTPVGSVPVPGTFKGVLTSGKEKLTGHNPEVLINKLGERLAFERTGVRMYEALITKCENSDSGDGQRIVDISLLKQFQEEEAEHFLMIREAMESMGADSTAQTPDADYAGLSSLGIIKVLTEPRTSISQSLNAILAAEMADGAGWELLVDLCSEMGLPNLSSEFTRALEQEEKHLLQIKTWLRQLTMGQAGMKLSS